MTNTDEYKNLIENRTGQIRLKTRHVKFDYKLDRPQNEKEADRPKIEKEADTHTRTLSVVFPNKTRGHHLFPNKGFDRLHDMISDTDRKRICMSLPMAIRLSRPCSHWVRRSRLATRALLSPWCSEPDGRGFLHMSCAHASCSSPACARHAHQSD